MGVCSIRASTGREATEVIRRVNPIHIAVVDLGLPLDQSDSAQQQEEGGPRLLELLARLDQPPPTVVVKRSRSHRDDCREIAAALRAGAFAVIDRPRQPSDLEILLDVLRRCLTRHYRGRWPGLA
jgi:CheY-like chemotaxis protein